MKFRKSHNCRRTFSAILLLMVMMLQMGVKVLHQHHYAENAHVACSDCEHHRVHHSHILSWDGSSTDCVVCQLFSSPFDDAKEAQFCAIPAASFSYSICSVADVVSTMQMHIVPRAPPACLL